MPSVVAYTADGRVLVGRAALAATAEVPPGNVLRLTKCLAGTRGTVPGEHVKEPYGVVFRVPASASENEASRVTVRVRKTVDGALVADDIDPVLVSTRVQGATTQTCRDTRVQLQGATGCYRVLQGATTQTGRALASSVARCRDTNGPGK